MFWIACTKIQLYSEYYQIYNYKKWVNIRILSTKWSDKSPIVGTYIDQTSK